MLVPRSRVAVPAPRGCAGWARCQPELPFQPGTAALHQTFLAELLQDKRKQNTCREDAEEAERKLLLYSRVWSPSFAAQESDKQSYKEIVMILTS